jgi:arylsulfatase A-like enzyme
LDKVEFLKSPFPDLAGKPKLDASQARASLPDARWQELIEATISPDIRLGAAPHPLVLKPMKSYDFLFGSITKNVLLAPSPTVLAVERPIRSGTRLSVGYAVIPLKENSGPGQVSFEISIQDDKDKKEKTIFSASLRPGLVQEHKGWFEQELDLAGFAGRNVKMFFKTSASDETTALENPTAWINPVFIEPNTKKKINVILISLDACRADHLGCYGYSRETSPNIDRLARQGVLFRTAIAQAPYTVSSHMSLLTSLYPSFHTVNTIEEGFLPPSIPTLAEILYNNGYRTWSMTGGGQLYGQSGFARGFETTIEYTSIQMDFERKVNEAIVFLEKERENNFFVFLHTYKIHTPYSPAAPYDTLFDPSYQGTIRGSYETIVSFNKKELSLTERDMEHITALYDGEIREADNALAKLLDYLEKTGLDKNTLIVVTADHGEEFGEHGRIGHSHTLYDEVLKVPLILRLPGTLPADKAISTQVQSVDILPTILDITGVKWEKPFFQGKSLMPLILAKKTPSWEEVAFSERLAKDGVHWRARRTPSSKYIFRSRRRTGKINHCYFDLNQDPGEQQNLKLDDALTQEMFAKIQFLLDAEKKNAGLQGKKQKLDEKTLETLRALGYLR